MKIQQWQYFAGQWKNNFTASEFDSGRAQLVLAFGDPTLSTNRELYKTLKNLFPQAHIVSSTTAGEIIPDEVYDDSMIVTAIQFENTHVRCSVTNEKQHSCSYEIGKHLTRELEAGDLTSIFVIADGTHINGSELVAGLNESNIVNMRNIPIIGGVVANGSGFGKTFVGLNQIPAEGVVVAVGFYNKLILKERSDQEEEALKKIFGNTSSIAGFYSYRIEPV